jgi:hypothetical protein
MPGAIAAIGEGAERDASGRTAAATPHPAVAISSLTFTAAANPGNET